MANKGLSFSSFLSGTPMITMNKLKGSKNYQSWANFVTLWCIGVGCEDHLTTTKSSLAEDICLHWRKMDALPSNIL